MNTRELGRWRKLWTRPSPQWEMLPALARGLGDEMLRYCDEQGRFPLGGIDPLTVVCRMLRAHPSERRAIKASLRALIVDGFVVEAGDALIIRNFTTAQTAITDSGERMRAMRERAGGQLLDDRGTTVGRLADDCGTTGARQQNGASTRNHSNQVRHSDDVREDQSRKEKNPPLNPPQGVGLGTLPLAKEKDRDEPSNVLRLPSREHLGVDPHEIAANHLGRRCTAFSNFPGGMLNEFREATAKLHLTTERWDTLGDWFNAGGTRTHRKNRPGWRWLLSGDVLVKSLADCKRWSDSNRPELGPDGLISPPKIQPKQAAKPALQASTILADLAEARANKATKEECEATKARHLARVAAAKAEEESRLANVSA